MEALEELLKKAEPIVVGWRRSIHQLAELSGKEKKTAEFVSAELRKMSNMQVVYPCETGVVGILSGGAGSRVLAFRADLDALPIEEMTGLPFASQQKGVMHACGHDGNTAMLLGAAWVLSNMETLPCKEVRFIFEPGEEVPPGFSGVIAESGVLEGVSSLCGVHVDAFTDVGSIRICPGFAMAASAQFDLSVHGNGGHAAFPHQLSDTVYVASEIVNRLQSIPSRMVDPVQPCVITVTAIRSSLDTYNIVPPVVSMKGTIRCLQDQLVDTMIALTKQIAEETAVTYGAAVEFRCEKGYGSVYNAPVLCDMVRRTAEKAGIGVVSDSPVMGGEAFAVYGKYLPACYVKVGTRSGNDTQFPHHHCRFDLNESGLAVGVSLLVRLAAETQSF